MTRATTDIQRTAALARKTARSIAAALMIIIALAATGCGNVTSDGQTTVRRGNTVYCG